MAEQLNDPCNGLLSYNWYRILLTVVTLCSIYVFLQFYVLLILSYLIYQLTYMIYDKYVIQHIETRGRAVFITGCDTGLGNRFARHLDDIGFVVFAGCLNTKSPGAVSLTKECSRRLHVIEVNATNDESIQRAVDTVKKQLPKNGLWGIVNNAGMNMLGDVELTPVSVYERGFNLNLYGYLRVIKSFLPLIRKSKGRIINVSSGRGILCEPGQSNYSTAKHAIETISDSLRLEMKKFNVKVSIIEPCNFGDATSIAAEHAMERIRKELDEMWQSVREEVKEGYSLSYLESQLGKPVGGWPPKADSSVVARAVEHALCSGLPKYRYLIQGKGSIVFFADEFAVITLLYNILPTWITDRYIVLWKRLKTVE